MSELYPKEAYAHYNYALTLLQLGEPENSLQVIELITNKHSKLSKGAEAEFMHDAHMLKAQCLWRIGRPLDATFALEVAKKFLAKVTKKKLPKMSSQQLKEKLWDIELQEMKQDLRHDREMLERNRAKSPTATHMTRYQESHGSTTLGDEGSRDFTDLGGGRPRKVVPAHVTLE